MQPDKRSKKAVRILLIIFLVSSIAAIGIGIAQVLPGYSGEIMEPYNAEWSLPVSAGDDIDVQVSASNIIISQHDGSDAQVHFEGERKPNRSGEMPEIIATSENGVLSIKERRYQQKRINIGMEDSDRIEGTLTIKLPAAIFGDVRINGYSGKISAENLSANAIQMDTSSGRIIASGITAAGNATFSGFSGAIEADHIVSSNLWIDTSSGSIVARNLTTEQKLTVDSFSGSQSLQQVSAGNALLDTSSGKVTISSMTARTLDIKTFSGNVEIKQSGIENAAILKTSSGIVTLNTFDASRLSLDTFSGSIAMEGITTGELEADTSSGNIAVSLLSGCPITAETFSGNISITVPPSIGFTYKIDTFSGIVNIGFPQITIGNTNNAESSGKVGNGLFAFDLKTSSGDISIQPQ